MCVRAVEGGGNSSVFKGIEEIVFIIGSVLCGMLLANLWRFERADFWNVFSTTIVLIFPAFSVDNFGLKIKGVVGTDFRGGKMKNEFSGR